MPQERTLEDRLRALERSVQTDAGPPPADSEASGVRNSGPTSAESTHLEARVTALEEQLTELEAGLQAVRGYVGNIEHVNQSVERRANAAIAAVERLESTPTTPPNLAEVAADSTPHPPTEDPPDGADEDEPRTSESPSAGLLERVTAHI